MIQCRAIIDGKEVRVEVVKQMGMPTGMVGYTGTSRIRYIFTFTSINFIHLSGSLFGAWKIRMKPSLIYTHPQQWELLRWPIGKSTLKNLLSRSSGLEAISQTVLPKSPSPRGLSKMPLVRIESYLAMQNRGLLSWSVNLLFLLESLRL